MSITKSTPARMITLLGIVALMMVASIPLLGSAQDSSPLTEQELIEEGEKIYNNVCIACHQPDGQGIEGIYLPLAGNPLVTLEDPTYLITTVLNGRGGMPRFDTSYDDEEIAAITTYIRQEWGNEGAPVSAEEVSEVREQYLMTTPTPEAQVPAGQHSGTPAASGDATPEATPED